VTIKPKGVRNGKELRFYHTFKLRSFTVFVSWVLVKDTKSVGNCNRLYYLSFINSMVNSRYVSVLFTLNPPGATGTGLYLCLHTEEVVFKDKHPGFKKFRSMLMGSEQTCYLP
jgi:hypothetical protein